MKQFMNLFLDDDEDMLKFHSCDRRSRIYNRYDIKIIRRQPLA